MNENVKEYQYINSVLRSVLRGQKPEELPEGLSFEGMVFYGIEKLRIKPGERLYGLWRQERDKAIARDFHQFHQYGFLQNILNENGIKYIPLKGTVLKELYPSTDMRYMCDLDILAEQDSHRKIRDILAGNGYEVEHYDCGNHDCYVKKPVVSIEIHRMLFSNESIGGKYFEEIFKNPFESAVQTEGMRFELNKTFFFMHLLAHAAKHYINGGVGFRAFMDIWLYFKNYSAEIDFIKIREALVKSGSYELCMDILELSQMWYGDKEYDRKFDEMSEYVFNGGAFGTVESNVKNQIKEEGRVKFILSSLFPSFKNLSFSYPIIKKIPVLYPFCIILRLFTKPFINYKRTIHKLKGFFEYKK